jgi:hypothetical protein
MLIYTSANSPICGLAAHARMKALFWQRFWRTRRIEGCRAGRRHAQGVTRDQLIWAKISRVGLLRERQAGEGALR